MMMEKQRVVKFIITVVRKNGYAFSSPVFTLWDFENGNVNSWKKANSAHDDECNHYRQFTGLLDRNRKEIYEGDIISYQEHEGYLMPSFAAPVLWISEYSCFGHHLTSSIGEREIPFSEHDELKHDILDYCEIIGNIYQHPNLLK